MCRKIHTSSSSILHYKGENPARNIRRMDARARLQTVIEEKGTTPRAVSLKAGLSDSMVHKFLTGQTKSMTVDNLEKVAKALGVTLRYLMFGEGDPDASHDNVTRLWDKIAERDRARALRVLETFADDQSDVG